MKSVLQTGFLKRATTSFLLIVMSFSVGAEESYLFYGTESVSPSRAPASLSRAIQILASKDHKKQNVLGLRQDLIWAYNYVQGEYTAIRERWTGKLISNINADARADSKQNFQRLADNGLSTIWQDSEFKNSSLGRAANSVEKKLNQDVVLNQPAEDSIQHKLNFNVQAFRSVAEIKYEGFFHASVLYKMQDATVGVEFVETLDNKKDLILSHDVKDTDRLSQVSLRWSF